MSTELSILGGNAQLPAHLQGVSLGVTQELMSGMFTGGNRIGLKGSRFRLIVAGVEERVVEENYLDVIFLGAAPAVSRQYFSEAYKQGENKPPACYSADGVVPNEDVKSKQSDKCATCPQNVKGSKLVDGEKYKACGYFRRIVVMLAGDTEKRMVFKLDVKGQGIFGDSGATYKSLNDYIKALQTRGVDAGQIVTRIKFDTDASVPKLLFTPQRYIDAEELNAVQDLVPSDEVKNLTVVTMATLDLSNENAEDEGKAAASKPQATEKAEPTKTTKSAKVVEVEEVEIEEVQAKPEPAKETPKPQPAPVQANNVKELDAILDDLDL